MTTSERLKNLLRLWAILLDVSPQTVMYNTMRKLKIKTFKDNDAAQKLAVTSLRNKLEKKEDDE